MLLWIGGLLVSLFAAVGILAVASAIASAQVGQRERRMEEREAQDDPTTEKGG